MTLSRWVTVAVVLLILGMPVTAERADVQSSPVSDSSPVEDLGPADAGTVPFQREAPGNNSSVLHANPAEVGEGGGTAENGAKEDRLANLQQWLTARIEVALVECAREAGVGMNGTCATLDGNYSSLVWRYTILAQETREHRDDNVSRVLNRTSKNQRAFVTTVRQYREALRTYRTEIRGEGRQRRSLARNVSRYGKRVETLGNRLLTNYAIIAGNSTMNVSLAHRITADVTANVTETTAEILTTEFEPAELTVSASSRRVSFRDPVVFRGQFRAANGTGLANRSIAVSTPESTLQTRTDADGEFTVTYRPRMAPIGNATIVTRYIPQNDSRYLETKARTRVSVQASEGTIRLNRTSSSVAFGDDVEVRGVFRVNGTGVAGVPIEISMGGVQVARTNTTESGQFAVSKPLLSSEPSGSSPLNVSIAQQGHALTADSASTTVRVEQSVPRLVVTTERIDADTARVSGRMVVGRSLVSDARLQIRRAGESLATVRTDEDGKFRTNVLLSDVSANESTAVSVVYDPPDGNLEPVGLQVDVKPAPGTTVPDIDNPFREPSLGPLGSFDPMLAVVGLLAFLVVLLFASGTVYGRELHRALGPLRALSGIIGALVSLGGGEADRSDVGDGSDGLERERATESTGPGNVGEGLLDTAQKRLNTGGTDGAVVGAYRAAKRQLDARLALDPTLTHWELLFVYRESLDENSRDALERLTAAYERAAFSSAQSTTETAREALESASVIVERNLSAHGTDDDE